MKILFAASECVPFVKTGGLADVVGALAPVLAQKGHDVRVIIPMFSVIPEDWVSQMTHVVDFEVDLGWRRQYCGIEQLKKDGVVYYFVDNKYYFGRSYIYGLGGDEYERFGFFCRGVLNALPLIGFIPDIIHANDWQTGMLPALLKIQYAHLPDYANIRTVYTIHNLQYQGVFGIEQFKDVFGLGDEFFTADKLEHYGAANCMKAGIVYADEITTVSPSYAEEIQTAYYGERLDGLLRARRNHLSGVLNGIDMVDYDPATDPQIARTYTLQDLSGKAEDKRALQEQLGLEQRPDVPIIGMVGRLSNQKGLDLVDYIIGELMQEDIQLVVLGMGEAKYFNLFSWAEQHYPGRVAARFQMDIQLSHRIYAGADMFLMPSQFEPCGLSQMIALRYGTVPIVRETGGLRDTVLSYNEANGAGNGFTFFNYNAHDMLYTIRRALYFYHNRKDIWYLLQTRGMEGDYSWSQSADTYLSLYQSVLHPEAPAQEPPVAPIEPAAPVAEAPKKPRSRKKTVAEENAPADKAPKKRTAKK
ncbi:MAG: glycogen synthase GlgA [Clostridia bacterium]|nr:glycogen synthase GlgA [Clostridia bacterium]